MLGIDLHTHSDESDGTFTPSEVVRRAAELGLDVVALTDHDTTAGLEEAAEAAREVGVELVPGVEFSAEHERTKDALAVAKAGGKKLGHPSPLSPQTRRKVLSLRRRGLSADSIAQGLNVEGVPTPSGRGRWHETTVQRILDRERRDLALPGDHGRRP